MKIGTLNVRTLSSEESLTELQEAFEEKELDIFGLGEMRRKYETITELKFGNILFHTESTKRQRGVGFLIKNEWKNNILEFQGISDRIATVKIRIKTCRNLTVIQVYAPTAMAIEEKIMPSTIN